MTNDGIPVRTIVHGRRTNRYDVSTGTRTQGSNADRDLPCLLNTRRLCKHMDTFFRIWQGFSRFSTGHELFPEPVGGGPLAQRLFRVMHGHDPSDKLTALLDRGLVAIVLLAIFLDVFIAHRVSFTGVQAVIHGLDWLATVLLTVEFVTKFALLGLDPRLQGLRFKGLRFLLRPMSVLDMIVLVPSWLSLMFAVELGLMRLIRLLRLLEVVHGVLPKWNAFLRGTEGQSVRKRTYEALFGDTRNFGLPAVVDIVILATILVSVLTLTLESVGSLNSVYSVEFRLIDAFVTAVFLVEYAARLYCCVEGPRSRKGLLGRIRYALTWGALIDLMAVLPLFLGFFFGLETSLLLVLRLLRVLKLSRYSPSFQCIGAVIREQKAVLLSAFLMMSIVTTIAAFGAYVAESEMQPEKFSSIPAAMYWAVVTLTTIGYGDIYPVTVVGQAMTMVLAIAGLGMIALPAGILATGFSQKIRQSSSNRQSGPGSHQPSDALATAQPEPIPASMGEHTPSALARHDLAMLIAPLSRADREALLVLTALSLSERSDS